MTSSLLRFVATQQHRSLGVEISRNWGLACRTWGKRGLRPRPSVSPRCSSEGGSGPGSLKEIRYIFFYYKETCSKSALSILYTFRLGTFERESCLCVISMLVFMDRVRIQYNNKKKTGGRTISCAHYCKAGTDLIQPAISGQCNWMTIRKCAFVKVCELSRVADVVSRDMSLYTELFWAIFTRSQRWFDLTSRTIVGIVCQSSAFVAVFLVLFHSASFVLNHGLERGLDFRDRSGNLGEECVC